MSSYEEDVRFVTAFARGGDWELGLRVARNVDPGPIRGDKKVTLTKFASDVGLSKDSVSRYYKAWEKAAADKVVDPADSLVADSEYDWEASGLTQEDWAGYYDAARYGDKPASQPKRPPSKKDVTDAIKSDPDIAAAAEDALADKLVEAAQDAQLEAIQRGGKVTPVEPKVKAKDMFPDVMEEVGRAEPIHDMRETVETLRTQADQIVANGEQRGREAEFLEPIVKEIGEIYWQLSSIVVKSEAGK